MHNGWETVPDLNTMEISRSQLTYILNITILPMVFHYACVWNYQHFIPFLESCILTLVLISIVLRHTAYIAVGAFYLIYRGKVTLFLLLLYTRNTYQFNRYLMDCDRYLIGILMIFTNVVSFVNLYRISRISSGKLNMKYQ